jgi:sucrose-6-phosphate hydrolase SacC (GH32 family)
MTDIRTTGRTTVCGIKKANIAINDRINTAFNKNLTLPGTSGFKTKIIIGNVIKSAIAVDETSVEVTTIGIDLINSPIMPLASNSGTNAQTVVMFEDIIGTRKSFQTRMPVCCAVNFLER